MVPLYLLWKENVVFLFSSCLCKYNYSFEDKVPKSVSLGSPTLPHAVPTIGGRSVLPTQRSIYGLLIKP